MEIRVLKAHHRGGIRVSYATTLPAPTVISVSPSSGSTAGGDSITVTGTGFVSGATVKLSGTSCTSVVVVNSTTITCVTPAHTAGLKTCRVTNPDAQYGDLLNAFEYQVLGSAPVISSLNYSQGDTLGGGQSIVLTGTDFDTATAVSFGGTSATFTIDSATQITATLPAHAAGTVSLTVTNPYGTSAGTSFEFWSLAELSCAHLQTASYGGDPWVGLASAGSSGSRSLTVDTGGGFTVPTVGSGVGDGGFTPLVKDSTNDAMRDGATALNALIGTHAYTLIDVVKPVSPVSATINATNRYVEAQLICEGESGGAYLGLGVHTTNGTDCNFSAYHLDVNYQGPIAAGTRDAWNVVIARFDDTTPAKLGLSVNGGADVEMAKTTIAGSPGGAASRINIGTTYHGGAGSPQKAEHLAYALIPSRIDDTTKAKVYAWARQRFGVA